MNKIARLLKQITYTVTATAMGLTSLLAILPGSASAAGQVQSRSIQLSSSSNAASAATTSYNVKFTTTSTYTGKGIVVDFCTNSPIIGDTTCTAPTGFTIGGSPTITTNSAPMNTQTWTVASANAGRTLEISQATGVSFTNATVADFTINNVQNPTSAVGTFYARIYTYDTTAGATSYVIANVDTGSVHKDDGGIALSTASQVTVTAKVQETLLFCVYTSGANCAGGTVAGLVLGDAFGVLSSSTTAYLTSTNATTPLTAKLGIASNATTGVTVMTKATGTLTSGANTIVSSGAGSGSCTADSSTASVEQFGFNVAAGASQTADAGYACGAGSHSFDTTNTPNLTSTFGDRVLFTAGPTVESAGTVDFVGKSSTTTKSGVYTSTLTFIATGIY